MRRKKSNYRYGLSTYKGSVRSTNEDSVYLNRKRDRKGNELLVTVVADGMGGYEAGDVASRLVVNELDKWFRNKATAILALPYPLVKIAGEMENLLKEINNTLLHEMERTGKRMGTTASILFLYNNQYFIIHIGDSRIYQITSRKDSEEQFYQLTEDHSWVMNQVRRNLMTLEEAKQHPKKNVIMQCLGINNKFSPFMKEGTFSQSDIFLLCSDGFYEIYPEEVLLESVLSMEASEQAYQILTDFLVKDADDRGATDNITVSIVSPK